MKQRTATRKRSAAGRVVRSGRPPRELAGEVEGRILDAAAKVFLERGFEGASVDEIAEVACAGKPTIYARFPGKEALFNAETVALIRAAVAEARRIPDVAASVSQIGAKVRGLPDRPFRNRPISSRPTCFCTESTGTDFSSR